MQGRLQCLTTALQLVEGKAGLEIGGPTTLFRSSWTREYGWVSPLPIYDRVGSLDNCNFARETIWAHHLDEYRFSSKKAAGKIIIADGSVLAPVADHTYDFVLSSHNLEHFANPVKALVAWRRVTRPGGGLILVLPDYRRTFDHRRRPTAVAHMFADFERGMDEDDATHVAEVIELHDISLDGTLKLGTREELETRSRANISNRILHHHVFDEQNSRELLERSGVEILSIEMAKPYHIVIVGRWSFGG